MKEKNNDIELYSEEVQEVMGKVPPGIMRYGIMIIMTILILLFIGSAFFSYPDKVSTEFTLTTQNPPTYLIAATGSRIENIYVTNGQYVSEGDYVAVLENTANTEEILFLLEQVLVWQSNGSVVQQAANLFLHQLTNLGSVQSSYAACIRAWNNYLQNMNEYRIYETELRNAISGLHTSIIEWKHNYLMEAPISGKIAFMQLWKQKQLVASGETMFAIIPENDLQPIGKALLPMQGVAKVHIGQSVNIYLEGFADTEYGNLKGYVTSISPVPDENGRFVVEVTLPDGLITTRGEELPVMKIMTGTADIITEEKSLLKRLIKI